MVEYVVYLCGHLLDLAKAELTASLEAEKIEVEEITFDGQLVFIKSNDELTPAVARCSLAHMVIRKMFEGEVIESKLRIISGPYYPPLPSGSTFCARVYKIGDYEVSLTRVDLERIIGGIVGKYYHRYGHNVNLSNPDVKIVGILVGRKVYVGLELWEMNRKEYIQRDPGNRPSFRPGAMKTDFARAMVNLSRIRKNEKFLDPFCGSGGLLLEAMLLKADVFGLDLDRRALKASTINLREIGKTYYSLVLTDSRKMPILSQYIDAVATDPPYAIQSSTYGNKITELVRNFLIDVKRVLKKGKYVVFSLPAELEGEKIAKSVGLEVKDVIDERIHQSLIRRVVVAVNK